MASDLFISANELYEDFSFYGNFYRTKKLPETSFRNILSIVPKQKDDVKYINFNDYVFDAIFVMMNPGGSTPSQNAKDYQIKFQEFPSTVSSSLVIAKPDQTQYQVCRVAKAFNWKTICIINLSDVRETQSGVFSNYIAELNSKFPQHTIFSEERECELIQVFNQLKDKTNVITAWGMNADTSFLELTKQAMSQLIKFNIQPIGLCHPEIKTLYKHPLPMPHKRKVDWLDDMVAEIRVSKK